MRINICIASGESYWFYMSTTIVSILKTSKKTDDLHFYIFCNKVSDKLKDYVRTLCKFKFFQVDFFDIDIKDFEKFPNAGKHITNATYFRYKIAELCPNIDKIIYLDCDIIVKQSLSELFEIDLTDYYLAGVEDVGYYYWRNVNLEYIYKDCFYINAGVLLINLDAWRKNDIYNKLVEFTIKEKDKIKIGDQDVINQVCLNKIKKLDYKWNVQDSFYGDKPEKNFNPDKEKIISASVNPAIIHYTNKKKPWNSKYMPRIWDWIYFEYLRLGRNSFSGYFFIFACFTKFILHKVITLIKNSIKFIFNIKTIEVTNDYRIIKILCFKVKRKI